jgi:imidazolonepropionase-like amidohydrolase
MAAILFKNAALVDGTGPNRREGCQLLVESERIKEVSDKPIKAKADRTIDLKGMTLMPGLTDAHIHVVAMSLRIADIEHVPHSLVALTGRQYLEAMLMRGFTTVRDAGGADWGYAQGVESGLIKGPRLLISGRALSQTGGHGDVRPRHPEAADPCACAAGGLRSLARIADGIDAVRQAARDELRLGANQIKIMASGGVASPTDPIWNLQYSEGEVRAIVEEAASWRTYVMAHAYTAPAIRRSVEFGVRSIEHGNLIDRPTADFMAKKGAFLVPTLVTYEALEKHGRELGVPDVSMAKLKDIRKVGLTSLDHAKAAKVKVGFGTDLLGELHRYQCREFSIRAEALDPWEVIAHATRNNAELFNMSGQIGCLEAGAFADLLVVDGNPLKKIGVLEQPDKHLKLIMKAGAICKDALN